MMIIIICFQFVVMSVGCHVGRLSVCYDEIEKYWFREITSGWKTLISRNQRLKNILIILLKVSQLELTPMKSL